MHTNGTSNNNVKIHTKNYIFKNGTFGNAVHLFLCLQHFEIL
uniref:Uncharacterized protein n=1 Tax=Anguilla anguilla TaxID=7936 RepID=A0A0E9SWY2_ANGAN